MRRMIGIALVLASLASGALAATAPESTGSSESIDSKRALRRTPVVEVFEQCRDAVVNISTTQIVERRSRMGFDSMFDQIFDFPSRSRRYELTSVGSGFVIHEDGYVVTNAHVVARTVERRVIFADGRQYDADLVAIDTDRDLAVLKINTDRKLKPIHLGRSDDLMIGETVVAVGNPLGFQHTLTTGVVSALDRSLEIQGHTMYQGLIQTDASINPGNSGGPLLNVLGELIGINTAIRGDAQNIGFSIPVDQLRAALPEMLDIERRYRLEIGLAIGDDARVTTVRSESPAARAGIKPDDRLLSVDGRDLHTGIDFWIDLIGRRPGDEVVLQLDRGGNPVVARLEIKERPSPDGIALAASRFGIRTESLTPEQARQLGLRAGGLLVRDVEAEGPADRAGIFRGDILVSINRAEVRDMDDVGMMLESIPAGREVQIVVLRPGERALYSGTINAR